MGHVANAIGWLTVGIVAAIVSLQVAYLLSADSCQTAARIEQATD